MHVWKRWYLVAVAVPAFLLLTVPSLRGPLNRVYELQSREGLSPLFFGVDVVRPGSLDDGNGEAVPLTDEEAINDAAWSVDRPVSLQLAKANPHQTWLSVRALLNAPFDERVAGPWEQNWRHGKPFSPNPFQAAAMSASPGSSLRPFLDQFENPPEEIDAVEALDLARQGQSLEPNNTFFDWMAARFLFTLNRDQEAIEVLEKATHKSGFDMHWRDLFNSAFRFAGKTKPLLADEKIAYIRRSREYPASEEIFGHIVNLALFTAMKREDAGNVNGAIDIERALAQLSLVRQKRSLFRGEKFAAAYMAEQVWKAPEFIMDARKLAVNPSMGQASATGSEAGRAAIRFATYVKIKGRPSVSAETKNQSKQVVELWAAAANPKGKPVDNFPQMKTYTPLAHIYQSYWAGKLALYQWAGAVTLSAALLLLGPLFPPKGQKFPRPKGRKLVKAMLTGIISAVALTFVGGHLLRIYWLTDSGSYAQHALEAGTDAGVIALLVILSPFLAGFTDALLQTSRLLKTAPVPVPRRFSTPAELGESAESDFFFQCFWKCQRVIWFRVLPIVAISAALFCMAVEQRIAIPWMGGQWKRVSSPTPFLSLLTYPTYAVAAFCVLMLLFRWRFSVPREHKAIVFSGFLHFRWAVGWSIPISLWFLMLTVVYGNLSRPAVDNRLQKFLNSEKPE